MTVIKEPFIKCSFLISPVSSSLFNPLLTVAGDNPFSSAFKSKRKSDAGFLFSFIVSKLRNWMCVND